MEHYHLHGGRIYYRTVLFDCIRLALEYIITPSDCSYSRFFFLTTLTTTTVCIISQISFVYLQMLIFWICILLHRNLSLLLLTVYIAVCIHLFWKLCVYIFHVFCHPAWKMASKTQREKLTSLTVCLLNDQHFIFFFNIFSLLTVSMYSGVIKLKLHNII